MEHSANRDGSQPPLFEAVQAKDVELVQTLLAEGADPSAISGPFGWTALHVAAGYNATAATEALLAARVAVDVRSSDGETPLHIAAQEGHTAEVRLLIAHAADPNATNEDGETPLHTAVQHIGGKSKDHIEALLELRADPTRVDSAGLDAMQHARVSTNRGQEVENILRKSMPREPAATEGDSTLQTLFAKADGSDVDRALRAACTRGQVSCIRPLLDLCKDGAASAAQRMLVAAAAGGHVEAAVALADAGADASAPTLDPASGSTPLVAAADADAAKTLRWLLAQRADPSLPSREGATALMAAALRGSVAATSALLAASADLDAQAEQGWTALMFASHHGNMHVARLLLDAGAALDVADATGATARQLATVNGHGDVVKLLETHHKLQSRRAKAGAKAAAGSKLASRVQEEDTRDVEALLAALEEPKKGPKRKGGQKPAGGAAEKAGPGAALQAALESPTKAAAPAPQTRDTFTPAARKTPAAGAKKAASATPPRGQVVGSPARQEALAGDGGEEKAQVRLAELRGRLAEVAQERAALDAEELALRREIMDLESVADARASGP